MTRKYRDAGTGQYVTKSYANRNPRTTVGENDKPNKPTGSGGKGKK